MVVAHWERLLHVVLIFAVRGGDAKTDHSEHVFQEVSGSFPEPSWLVQRLDRPGGELMVRRPLLRFGKSAA